MRVIIGFLLLFLHGVALNAQTPGYFDLTVRLRDGDNILRDKIIADLRATVIPDNVETTIASVETNYDGYVTIKISTSMANGKKIDWTIPNKHVKIEGRPGGSQAGLKVLADDQPLLVSAYSNVLFPNKMKINASIDGPLWEVTNARGTAISGNSNSSNAIFGYTQGSNSWSSGVNGSAFSPPGKNSDVRGLVGTYWDDNGASKPLYQTAGEIGLRSKAADFWKVWRNPNTKEDEKSSHLYILEGEVPNIQLSSNYGNPYMEVRSPRGYARMSIESDQGGRLGIRSQNDIVLDAGDGLAFENKKQIIFNAKDYVFSGGAIHAKGFSDKILNNYNSFRYVDKSNNGNREPDLAYIKLGDEDDEDFKWRVQKFSIENQESHGIRKNFSIIADNEILCKEMNVFSDVRIKNSVAKISSIESAQVIKKIEPVAFRYIDFISNGTESKLGFIAQQVALFFPEAVSKTKGYIPNIFKAAKKIEYLPTIRSLVLNVDSLSGISLGDKLRLIADGKIIEGLVSKLEGNNITIKDWLNPNTKEAFVYGKEVNDFSVVDYDRIFTLNVSATQALIEKVETLEEQVSKLQKENEILHTSNSEVLKRLGALESCLKTIIGSNKPGLDQNKPISSQKK